MGHEFVAAGAAEDLGPQTGLRHGGGQPLPHAAVGGTVLNGQQNFCFLYRFQYQLRVQRGDDIQFHHFRLDALCGQKLGGLQRVVDQDAIAHQGDVVPLAQHGGVAGSGIALIGSLAPPGVADGHRAVHMEDGLLQHPSKLGIAGRRQHRHAGDAV